MRSYCRIKSQIGDWSKTVLAAWPADDARQHARASCLFVFLPQHNDGARVPKRSQLPDDLKDLALRNGIEVRHASFSNDMARLIRGLRSAKK